MQRHKRTNSAVDLIKKMDPSIVNMIPNLFTNYLRLIQPSFLVGIGVGFSQQLIKLALKEQEHKDLLK